MQTCGREREKERERSAEWRDETGAVIRGVGFLVSHSSFFILHEHIGTTEKGISTSCNGRHSALVWYRVEADRAPDGLVIFSISLAFICILYTATMASVLSYRPSTSGTATSSGINRQGSLSSFPSSRTPSNPSIQNGILTANHPPLPHRGSVSSSRTPSTPSSTMPVVRRAHTGLIPGKVKSQYPADSPERHVEYILVAAFHVDRGPIMEHQYPGAISGDENMLAELMLPDQAHMRNEDWTIFFLHKDTSEEADRVEKRRKGKRRKEGERDAEKTEGDTTEDSDEEESSPEADTEDQEVEGGEGPPLIYVLNLVNTKQDNTAKRFSFLPISYIDQC